MEGHQPRDNSRRFGSGGAEHRTRSYGALFAICFGVFVWRLSRLVSRRLLRPWGLARRSATSWWTCIWGEGCRVVSALGAMLAPARRAGVALVVTGGDFLAVDAHLGTSHRHINDSHDCASSARPVPKGPELHLLQPHLVDQMIVGRGLNDAVELGPVGAYEADTVEANIVYRPPRADQVEPVVNGELVLLANGDLGTDRGVLTIYRLTEVLHSLPGVVLDLAEVQVFQYPLEEASELLPLLGSPVGPVPPQAAPGHLGEVEEGLDNPLDLLATPLGGRRPSQRGILRDLHHLLSGSLDRFRRAGRRCGADRGEEKKRCHESCLHDSALRIVHTMCHAAARSNPSILRG